MKLLINVNKDGGKILKPSREDIIIYDGAEWYVTTKQDLFKEIIETTNEAVNIAQTNLENAAVQLKQLEKDFNDFKVNVSKQLLEMTQLIKTLYEGEN